MFNGQDKLIINRNFRFIFNKLLKLICIIVFLVLIYICLYKKELINKTINKNSVKLLKLSNFLNTNICDRLIIEGVKYANYDRIKDSVKNYCSDSSFTISDLENKIIQDPWIREIYIHKKLPNNLNVNITERIPFALLKNNNSKFQLIDTFGDIINISENEVYTFEHLLTIIYDNFNKNEVNNLFNIFSVHSNLAKKIKSIERISDRRWNLRLNNNILIKMPEENDKILEIWDILNNLLGIYGLEIGLKEIDLRVNGKVFLKYENSIAKEIKNL